MRRIRATDKQGEFDLLHQSRSAQAAMMTLRPGAVSDEGVGNEHPRSEQWLYVVAGTGQARIGKQRQTLRTIQLEAGDLLLIQKGELHQISNAGMRPLVTLNLYVPPAYDRHGEPR